VTVFAELLVSVLMLIGASFVFIGSYGLAKLPDLMTRLHAPTKASTLGVGSILLASVLHFTLVEGTLSLHELLISVFIFITAPIAALMISKAYIFRVRGETAQKLPPTGRPVPWATLGEPAAPESEAVRAPTD
jgi:multicomponent K+:H+ antiporter subunit G